MASGWVLAGFSDELPGEVVDLTLGGQPILLVRAGGRTRAFDGTCPHRGARLGRGGRLGENHIVCPFHGYRIRLGRPAGSGNALCATEHRAIEIAEMVFVHLGDAEGAYDCGFAAAIADLKARHVFVHGFSMALPASPMLVIENAFDVAHFGPVHGVPGASTLTVEPFDPAAGRPLTARGQFHVAASEWDAEPAGTPVTIDYEARAYGPGLIVSTQRGSNPYSFLVAATSDSKGGSVARVVLMLPKSEDGVPPSMDRVEWLLTAMEGQLTADRLIWEGLPANPPRNLQPGEEAIAAFWDFCDRFPDPEADGRR